MVHSILTGDQLVLVVGPICVGTQLVTLYICVCLLMDIKWLPVPVIWQAGHFVVHHVCFGSCLLSFYVCFTGHLDSCVYCLLIILVLERGIKNCELIGNMKRKAHIYTFQNLHFLHLQASAY